MYESVLSAALASLGAVALASLVLFVVLFRGSWNLASSSIALLTLLFKVKRHTKKVASLLLI